MNYIYPNGTGCLYINGSSYDLTRDQTEQLVLYGVDFTVFNTESPRSRVPRGLNKVYACCRISQPDGTSIVVANMKRWVSLNFSETYGWVMMNLKLKEGYKGYKAERLFKISVTASKVSGFSAIPLDQPEGHPWVKIDEWVE